MSFTRRLPVIVLVHAIVLSGFSQTVKFETLDNSNALNPEYRDFKWGSWKVAVAFARPIVTRDSLEVQTQIFKDIYPSKPFYDFLTEEIAHTLSKKSQFAAFEWHPIAFKKEMKCFDHKDKWYYAAIPDSSLEVFRTTGCRFALLLQKFSPALTLCNPENIPIVYEKTAIEHKNLSGTCLRFSFSFSYVIYDLMEDKVVQFGNAFDDNKSKRVTADEIKHCLNCALIDVLEVSRFYYK